MGVLVVVVAVAVVVDAAAVAVVIVAVLADAVDGKTLLLLLPMLGLLFLVSWFGCLFLVSCACAFAWCPVFGVWLYGFS